jgi:hypothetical protein
MSQDNLEVSIIRSKRFYWLFISMALAAPLLVLFSPFAPKLLVVENAFQRSGALVIVLALIAEYFAIDIFNQLKPPGGNFYAGSEQFQNALNKFRGLPKKMTILVVFIIALGTLINSFGEMLISF